MVLLNAALTESSSSRRSFSTNPCKAMVKVSDVATDSSKPADLQTILEFLAAAAAPTMAMMIAVVFAETGGGGVSCDLQVALDPTGKVNAIITYISGKSRKV